MSVHVRVLTAYARTGPGFMIDAHTLPYMHIICAYNMHGFSADWAHSSVLAERFGAAEFFRTPGQLLAVF